MNASQSQWRGLRARYAAHWFNSRARLKAERGVLDAIRNMISKDDTVLDLGAGTGHFTLAVAPLLDEGTVVAVDLSPDMLAGLNRHAATRHLSAKIETVVADVAETGLPDASVDVVMSGNVLHELPDPTAAVGEMARVLRPNGQVVIHDFRDGIVGRIMKLLHHHGAHGALGMDEIRRYLHAAGFADVEVTSSGVRYLATARKNGACAA